MATLEELREQAAQARYGMPYDQLIPARKAWVTMDLKGPEEVEQAIHTTFSLERDLQLALRANIEQLEHGLKVADGGTEQTVASGRIDITAEDHNGNRVVIELKAGTADRETIGQILGYMGDLSQSKKPVRGIIVAGDFAPATISALGALPNLQLKKYSFKFSFESVGQDKK
jgi:RecB family endonuclease NucS